MNNYKLLKQLQETYPNIRTFTCDENYLVYNGVSISVDLSQVDPVFFNLNTDSIFNYLKNGIYKNWNINKKIEKVLQDLVVTEEEVKEMNYFMLQLFIKRDIIKNNIKFFSDFADNLNVRKFYNDYLESNRILNSAISNRTSGYPANEMLATMSENEQNKTQSKSLDLGMTRTREKSNAKGYSAFIENEKYLDSLNERQRLNAAGFTSIILIISTVISVATYLALQLLK